MKKNVGEFDSFIRIWCGLFMLGLGINRSSGHLMAIGAGKVAEGITRFCPMLYMMGISTTEMEAKKPKVPLFKENRRNRRSRVLC